MFAALTKRSCLFSLASLIAVAFMLGTADPADAATTTAKKVQRKLHKLERDAGKVLRYTGEAAVLGAGVGAGVLGLLYGDPEEQGNSTGDYRTSHQPSPPPVQHQPTTVPVPHKVGR
jgi:hypothetical protein